jgi:hypothetical protein
MTGRGAVHGANYTSTCEGYGVGEFAQVLSLAGGGGVRSMDCPSRIAQMLM